MSTDTLTGPRTGALREADNEGWGIAAASVALLTLGVLMASGFKEALGAHDQAETSACHPLSYSWTVYATAYTGLVATVAALVFAVRRLRQPLRPRGPVQMAGMVLPAGLLLLGLQFAIMWTLYQPSPGAGGIVQCLK